MWVAERTRSKANCNLALLDLRIEEFKHRVRVAGVTLKATIGDEGEHLEVSASYELFLVELKDQVVD